MFSVRILFCAGFFVGIMCLGCIRELIILVVKLLGKRIGTTRDLLTKFVVKSMKKVYTKGPDLVKIRFEEGYLVVLIDGFLLEFERMLLEECGEKAEDNLGRLRTIVFESRRKRIKKRLMDILEFNVCHTGQKFDFINDSIEIRVYANEATNCDECKTKFCHMYQKNPKDVKCR